VKSYKVVVRPKTYHRYKGLIDKHIVPYIGGVKLKELHPLSIENFYSQLLSNGLSPRSTRHVHSVLHRALEKAVGYGLLLRNPATGVNLPQYKPAEMKIWDENQVSIFLITAHESAHKALYHLAITTGMRQGEIFGLKWSDLHWNNGILQVERQVQHIPGEGWSFAEPKTRAGRRSIQLGDGTIMALRAQYQHQQVIKAANADRWRDHDLIFPSSVGTPQNASNLRLDFNQVIQKAQLPKIRFHDLRHTAASLMLNHGVPLIVVSRMLGHAKANITLDIYGHLIHEMQDEAAKVMDELVTPIPVMIRQNEPTNSSKTIAELD
jgi:integrase